MKKIIQYLSLVKFSHTLFAMPFALIGLTMAYKNGATINVLLFVEILICMVTARNAAMGFNRYLDRNIDAKNPRTITREIPSNKISPINAFVFVIANCIIFIAVAYLINFKCFILSPVALFILLFYSYTKRFTALCHLVLGLGLSIAPTGAYIALADEFSVEPMLLSMAVLLWVGGFDIIYSLQDKEFDQKENLNSIPVLLGLKNALRVSIGMHFLSSICIILIGILFKYTYLYFCGCVIFSGLLIYQHSIVKYNDLSRVNAAFFISNGVASLLFAIFAILGFL